MNQIAAEKAMTVKEVAEILGVGAEAIKKHVRSMFPDAIQNGKTTYLNEYQVTEIKKRMQPTTQVVGATTDLEMAEKTMEVMGWLKVKVDSLKEENRNLRVKASVADQIANADGLTLLSDAGKQVNGRPLLFIQWMEDEGILFRRKSGGVLLPKAVFQDRGYFEVKSKDINGKVREQTYLTGKGLAWICAKYRKAHNLLPFPLSPQGEPA